VTTASRALRRGRQGLTSEVIVLAAAAGNVCLRTALRRPSTCSCDAGETGGACHRLIMHWWRRLPCDTCRVWRPARSSGISCARSWPAASFSFQRSSSTARLSWSEADILADRLARGPGRLDSAGTSIAQHAVMTVGAMLGAGESFRFPDGAVPYRGPFAYMLKAAFNMEVTMTKLGEKLIAAAREARAIACGDADPATYRIHVPACRRITLHLERRDDGGLCVYSPDVPGLVLAHADPHKVFADIGLALEAVLPDMAINPTRATRVPGDGHANTSVPRTAGAARPVASPAGGS
jgi:hypothetical protein